MGLDFEAWKEPQRPVHILRNITGRYNSKIQLLHCCIQSWGLSTPETLCMKGRMALLWSSFLLISFWMQWAKKVQIQSPSVPLQSHTHPSQDLQKFHPGQLWFKAILLIGSRTPNFTTGLNTGDGRVYSTLWSIHSPSVCLWNWKPLLCSPPPIMERAWELSARHSTRYWRRSEDRGVPFPVSSSLA